MTETGKGKLDTSTVAWSVLSEHSLHDVLKIFSCIHRPPEYLENPCNVDQTFVVSGVVPSLTVKHSNIA